MRNLNILLIGTYLLAGSFDRFFFPLPAIAIFGLVLIPRRQTQLAYFAFVSYLSLLFFPNYESVYRKFRVGLVVTKAALWQGLHFDLALLVLVRASALGLYAILLFVIWNQLLKPLRMMAFSLAVILGLMFLSHLALEKVIPGFLFIGMSLAIVSRTYISALVFRNFQPREPFRWRRLIFIYPFFQLDIPLTDPTAFFQPPQSNPDQTRLFRQLCVTYAAAFICLFTKWLAFDSTFKIFSNYANEGYLGFVSGGASLSEAWFNFLFQPLIFTVTVLWALANSFCILFQVLGYDMENSFNEPWRAKSFSDFMARMYHYYSRYVTYLFYVPLVQRTRFLRRFRPLDQLLIVFISIFLFSMAYHLSREYWITFDNSPQLITTYLRGYLLYSFILSILICLSLTVERSPAWRNIHFSFRFPLYALVYATLYHFAVFQKDTLEIKWLSLKLLFGGS